MDGQNDARKLMNKVNVEPRGISSSYSVIVRVRVVLRRTVHVNKIDKRTNRPT